MKMRILLGAAACLLAGVGLAAAQQATNDLVSPTGTEAINTYSNTLLSQVYSTQLRDAAGYSKQSPASGSTLTFAYGQSVMQIGGASTLATLTIKLAAAPVDGQVNCFYTKPAVTALTLSLSTVSQTLNDAVTATSATSRYCYLYSLGTTTWDRVQ
jgi:hypothetical protein